MLRLLFIFLIIINAPAQARQVTTAKHAYIIDYETGQVLLDKDAEKQMPTSSMSKVMTMYMVFEALKNGTIDLNTKFKVSEKAWAKGGSKMFVKDGAKVKISDLIRGVIVQSGNDATIVLAEGLAGEEDKFAKLMTMKAKKIGMNNSNFMNASGWPDPDHYSTSKDLAVLATRMIEDFPEYYRFYSEKEFTYNAIKQSNRNPLLYRDIGADGLKTGHTEVGGYGLMGTAKNEDRRVIMVINGLESEKERAEEGTRLIRWALNAFENLVVVKKDMKVGEAPVEMGEMTRVDLTIDRDVKMTLPKSRKDQTSFKVNYQSPLIAPLKAGEEIGSLVISVPDQKDVVIPLLVKDDVAELGFFKKTLLKMQYRLLGAR